MLRRQKEWFRGEGAGRRVGTTRVEEGAGKEGDMNYASIFAYRFSNSECKVRKAKEGRKGEGKGRREEGEKAEGREEMRNSHYSRKTFLDLYAC